MQFTDPATARVPFFTFLNREHGIDQELSAEKGYDVPKLVTFILITPHGHRGDPMEFFAEEWIEKKFREAINGQYNMQWVDEFKAGLKNFREGKEIPRHGSPLILWERITESRRKALAPQFPTIEDLAAVPDSSLNTIGMDGRVLRDLARAEIQAKTSLEPVVRELAMEKENSRRLEDQVKELTAKLEKLAAQMEATKAAKV